MQGWSIRTLQKYICWVSALQPVLLPEAEAMLTAFYQAQRRATDRTQALTTIRMLEGLVRIAQAHAKLMARTEVTCQDAVVAILLVEASMQCAAGVTNALHSRFADDPDLDLQREQQRIMAECGGVPDAGLQCLDWNP